MNNQEIAKIFYEIASYLEIDRVPFKPYAYQRAAMGLEGLEEDVREIYDRGGLKELEEIPGIGKNIALKIEEYLKTGKIGTYERLKKRNPFNLGELTAVEGLGVRKSKILYQQLKIKNLKDLEKAAKAHKVASLEGFGEKTEKNILQGIAFLKRSKGRFLLGEIMPIVENIVEKLKTFKEVEKISVAGSVRRMKETIGDVDILAVSKKPEKVMAFFVSLDGVEKVWSQGSTKSSVRMKEGLDMDLRVVPDKSYGSALQYFTGSKEHNIATRRIAISKNLKLNEYGVFKGLKMIAGKNEEEVYKAIGLKAMEPELRENGGELEAALRSAQGKLSGLPKIIGYNDIKGDLHCHSNWDGGANSIEEIVQAAEKMGYQYIGISDHTKFLRIEKGLDEKQLLEQRKEIDQLNQSLKIKNLKLKILQGCEANILNDGSIDIKDEVLAKLDFVIAGVHSSMKMDKDKMTERIIKAMKNPNVDIISHPTGRILKRRDEYQADFDKILRAAKETNTILEINSSPCRLDLKDINIKKAKNLGVKMVINTDAHQIDQLGLIKYGVGQARRGWAEKKDIINTQPLSKLLQYFSQK
ncbi:MAG: DNA polymerase III [Candidatus Nealsonbacteria bacterium RBG_13_37_56]|uniref:DNA polymerase beta n=1 Tax=Candidatus Nealsonbacteria bacterium RBG_13_37_56 TaxID=1801661 RepID=A0A1G2DXL6_9BACT|nr:MAG: DNA polymerase III [Candidatus Nealsonbacteria bacterium RBG_13_37_56]